MLAKTMNPTTQKTICTWRTNRALLRCLAFAFAALLTTTTSAQEPTQLARAKQSHAQQLAKLSDSCAEKKLLNDAGRLLRTALGLVPGDSSTVQRQKQLRELWIKINRDHEKREVYKSFWSSSAYEVVGADLRSREQKVHREVIEKYLELADSVSSDDAGLADTAFRVAFEVDPKSPVVASRAGAERVKKFRRQRPGLAALQLGETVVGKPTDLQSLHGKVVLWRSFSL